MKGVHGSPCRRKGSLASNDRIKPFSHGLPGAI